MNPRRTDAEAAYWHAVRAKLPNAAENENRCRTFLAIGTVEELEDLGIQSNYLHHAVFDEKLSGSRIVEVSLPGYLYAPFVLNDNPVRAEIPYDLVAGKRSIGLPVGLPLVNERERMSQFPPTDNRLGRRRGELSSGTDSAVGKRGKTFFLRSGTGFQPDRSLPGKQPA